MRIFARNLLFRPIYYQKLLIYDGDMAVSDIFFSIFVGQIYRNLHDGSKKDIVHFTRDDSVSSRIGDCHDMSKPAARYSGTRP